MRSQPTSRPCWDHLWHVWHWIRWKQILPFVPETLHWQRIRRLQSQNDQRINRWVVFVCCWLRSERLNGQGSSLFWQDRWFVQTSQVTSQSRRSIEQDTIKQGGHLWIRSRNLNQFFSKLLSFSLITLTLFTYLMYVYLFVHACIRIFYFFFLYFFRI